MDFVVTDGGICHSTNFIKSGYEAERADVRFRPKIKYFDHWNFDFDTKMEVIY